MMVVKETPPNRVVMAELLVTPKCVSACIAIVGQRFSDFLETRFRFFLKCLWACI